MGENAITKNWGKKFQESELVMNKVLSTTDIRILPSWRIHCSVLWFKSNYNHQISPESTLLKKWLISSLNLVFNLVTMDNGGSESVIIINSYLQKAHSWKNNCHVLQIWFSTLSWQRMGELNRKGNQEKIRRNKFQESELVMN